MPLSLTDIPFPFNLLLSFILIVWVSVFVTKILSLRKLQKSGVSPITPAADIAGRLANSEMLAPAKSLEDRLANLDELLANGTISKEEHAAARINVISD